MSRIGLKPVALPAGVNVKIGEGNEVTVQGPKGTLVRTFKPEMIIMHEGTQLTVSRPSDDRQHKALHGLTRTLLNNMVVGVTEGFSKTLIIEGVGYRAAKQGKNLVMNLGYSHQVTVTETDDIKIEVPNANTIIVSGTDKQKVGQFACEIREKRPPEPYKGKGIHYDGEHIIRKEGKAGKGAKK